MRNFRLLHFGVVLLVELGVALEILLIFPVSFFLLLKINKGLCRKNVDKRSEYKDEVRASHLEYGPVACGLECRRTPFCKTNTMKERKKLARTLNKIEFESTCVLPFSART